MRYFLYTLLLLLFPIILFSQSASKQFKKLSRPEKHWVLSHPFIAKRAFHITKKVQRDVDSIRLSGIIGTDNNGGKLDAFKHAYWMAFLALEIGSKKALKLGKAHEKGNYLQYKKHLLEDSILPDSVSSVMDINNNQIGVSLRRNRGDLSGLIIQKKIMNLLNDGKLLVIKKDIQGNFLTCDGQIILLKEWVGKWNIPKCIVASNQ
jgi:hypothetical protein